MPRIRTDHFEIFFEALTDFDWSFSESEEEPVAQDNNTNANRKRINDLKSAISLPLSSNIFQNL